MRPARAYGETDVYKRQVQDALTDIVVADGGLDGLFGQDGAVHLVQGKAVQRFGHLVVGEGEGLLYRTALDHLGGHGTGGDGRAAAEGLEFGVGDDVVLDPEGDLHDIAAFGVSCDAHCVRVLNGTGVAGVIEVIHYLVRIHTRVLSLRPEGVGRRAGAGVVLR